MRTRIAFWTPSFRFPLPAWGTPVNTRFASRAGGTAAHTRFPLLVEQTRRGATILLGGLVLWQLAWVQSPAVRLKDVAQVRGVRSNQLIGYGLVVGLEGTGDSKGALFTVQSIANMLERFGITIPAEMLKVKNVAAVMVTAELPPFARAGNRIDVVVSSIGDARSLQGGTLLQTPLRGADGQVYAVAQGPLSIGGFNFGRAVPVSSAITPRSGASRTAHSSSVKCPASSCRRTTPSSSSSTSPTSPPLRAWSTPFVRHSPACKRAL
jgi:hypothetical protein